MNDSSEISSGVKNYVFRQTMTKKHIFSCVKFFLLVFVFLFAYGIKFFGIPLSVALDLLAFFYLLKTGAHLEFIREWSTEICLIFLIVLYSVSIELLFGAGISGEAFSFYSLRLLLDGLIPAFFLAKYAKDHGVSYDEFLRILIFSCLIQMAVATVMFLSPEMKFLYFTNVMNFSDGDAIMSPEVFPYRGYGIANTYLAWFPFLLGLIWVVVLLSNAALSKISFICFTCVIIILISLNARVAFLPIIIAVAFYFSFAPLFIKVQAGLVFLIMFAILFFIGDTLSIDGETARMIEHLRVWIWDNGFANLIGGSGNATVEDLSNFSILESFGTRDWIFGRGELITPEISSLLYTDVGYLQILYSGGLILSALLYFWFLLIFVRLIKHTNRAFTNELISKLGRGMPYVLFFSFFIGHMKLRIFEMNEATRFLLVLTSFLGAVKIRNGVEID